MVGRDIYDRFLVNFGDFFGWITEENSAGSNQMVEREFLIGFLVEFPRIIQLILIKRLIKFSIWPNFEWNWGEFRVANERLCPLLPETKRKLCKIDSIFNKSLSFGAFDVMKDVISDVE